MRFRFCVAALALGTLAVAVGCETTVDVDLPEHESQLVINELFAAGEAWRVSVTASRSIRDAGAGAFPPVEDATVEIRAGGPDGRVLDTLTYDAEHDVYRSFDHDTGPEQSETYAIRVSAPGFSGVAEAVGRAPAPVPLGSLSRGEAPEPEQTEIDVQLTDPEGRDDYYTLSVYQQAVRSDTVGLQVELSFSSTSPLLQENAQEQFIDDGPGEVRTTYYDGALFSDTAFEGETRRMSIRFTADNISDLPPDVEKRTVVVLTSLSEDRYEYRRTLRLSERTGENPFSEPVQIHSNVRGGLGIFAGAARVGRVVLREGASP
jgi:hypothetical protein